MARKNLPIVFVFITCEGCKKRYAAGVNPETLPETVACPGCGTEIEIVLGSTSKGADDGNTR